MKLVSIVFNKMFEVKHSIVYVQHIPYSPDLSLCDLFLFPKIHLKYKRFKAVQDKKRNIISKERMSPHGVVV